MDRILPFRSTPRGESAFSWASMLRWLNPKFLLVGAVVLLVVLRIGSELSGRGAEYWHLDLRTLYLEQTSFYRGVYPHAAVTPPPDGMQPLRSDYPPYSFVLFMPWIPPGWSFSLTAGWFTFSQLAAAALLVGFASLRGFKVATPLAVLLGAGTLAITGLHADLLFGNVASITAALLLGVYLAIARDCWWQAGGFWAGAMLKPQMGWAFALLFLNRQGWKALTAATAGLVVLSVAACMWTGVSLGTVLNSGIGGSWSAIARIGERYSLVSLLSTAGVPTGVAVIFCGLAGVGIILWQLRGPLMGASPLQRFAFVAIVNRICAYHNVCDDLLLAFPLVWLGGEAWTRNRASNWSAFCALGLSIWAPTTAFSPYPVKVAAIGLWTILAWWISRASPPRAANRDHGEKLASLP